MQDTRHAGNLVLIRGAALWILMALLLAWCMVGLNFGIAPLKAVFCWQVHAAVAGAH